MTKHWKPDKPRNDADKDKREREDRYIENNPDIQNPASHREKLNQAQCKGKDNDGGKCKDEALHHETEGDEKGKSGWCLKHWLGGSDSNE